MILRSNLYWREKSRRMVVGVLTTSTNHSTSQIYHNLLDRCSNRSRIYWSMLNKSKRTLKVPPPLSINLQYWWTRVNLVIILIQFRQSIPLLWVALLTNLSQQMSYLTITQTTHHHPWETNFWIIYMWGLPSLQYLCFSLLSPLYSSVTEKDK